jgi:hypothetical protein
MGVRKRYQAQVAAERAAEQSAPVVVTPAAAEGHPTVAVSVRTGPDTVTEYTKRVADADSHASKLKAQVPPDEDDATKRLQVQIEEMRRSEQLQRQAQLIQTNPREAKLHLWRQQGMDEPTERWLRDNPVMIDNHELTRHVAEQTAKHHPPGSDAHREATRQLFNGLMGKAEAERLARNAPQPPPLAPPRHEPAVHVHVSHDEEPDMPNSEGPAFDRRIHSAPIDRDAAGSRGNASGKVTLTPEERQFARQIGVSEVDYAKNKQKMCIPNTLSKEAGRASDKPIRRLISLWR